MLISCYNVMSREINQCLSLTLLPLQGVARETERLKDGMRERAIERETRSEIKKKMNAGRQMKKMKSMEAVKRHRLAFLCLLIELA